MTHWHPLCLISELSQSKALARTIQQRPLVAFLDENKYVAVLEDRCPHRGAALSQGNLCNGRVACPYHGWQFDSVGQCQHIPGRDIKNDDVFVTAFQTCLIDSLVFVNLGEKNHPFDQKYSSLDELRFDKLYFSSSISCSLRDALENFLDPFHTHFVHRACLRHDAKRQRVKVSIKKLHAGVEAQYSQESLQSGWVSRLLEGSRGGSAGRFMLPATAEVEYLNGKGELNFSVSAVFAAENKTKLRVLARLATRKTYLPKLIKHALIRPVFNKILQQDIDIVEAVVRNRELFSAKPKLNLSSDASGVLASELAALLDDGEVAKIDEREFYLNL